MDDSFILKIGINERENIKKFGLVNVIESLL